MYLMTGFEPATFWSQPDATKLRYIPTLYILTPQTEFRQAKQACISRSLLRGAGLFRELCFISKHVRIGNLGRDKSARRRGANNALLLNHIWIRSGHPRPHAQWTGVCLPPRSGPIMLHRSARTAIRWDNNISAARRMLRCIVETMC